MNYRHAFHAGNFADVMKHVMLLSLLRGLQRKPKGFLYLDTHAGRGRYDLTAAATGESLARKPEWPEGIGRLWDRTDLSPGLASYVALVRDFNRECGALGPGPHFYPGSPRLASVLGRLQDRLVFCEKHPAECAALEAEFRFTPNATVQESDGYAAIRALLPPTERRALVLIDPPFEAADEFVQIAEALAEGLRRLAGGVFAVWYPLTERARVDKFLEEVVALDPPPTLAAELLVAGPSSPVKLKGCGLLVINPPWKFEQEARPLLSELAGVLALGPGGGMRLEWIRPETAGGSAT